MAELLRKKMREKGNKAKDRIMPMRMWRKPLDLEEKSVSPATIHIIENRCKGCGVCVEYCPRSVLKMSEKFNQKGYHPPFLDEPSGCVACHFCEEVCPEFAIYCDNSSASKAQRHKGRT